MSSSDPWSCGSRRRRDDSGIVHGWGSPLSQGVEAYRWKLARIIRTPTALPRRLAIMQALDRAPAPPLPLGDALAHPDTDHPPDERASIRYANGRLKRAIDLTAGVVLSIGSAPIVAVLAIGSAVSFRAWPIFSQTRVGHDGHPFRFVKIRSLPTETPAAVDKYTVAECPNSRWGTFLRSTHLDELPQCWLMVTGRLSLVGPRPEMPSLAATFDPAFVKERTAVRPGATGTWQVSTAVNGLIGEAPEYDRLYLDHASLRLDAWVLFRTIKGFFGLSPLPLEEFPRWITDSAANDATSCAESKDRNADQATIARR